ncbi:MAG TPA: polyprenyl synthetase family protein [Candidatus Blautia merdigallinarum]|uniref:Farnesyl diphosphate synthase n=1 Tax=Candidatus Blautia merdigallinarum TaxID=2838495 RepID=A0A9D2SKA7_9FIRM|nr:polyprenyl synthetase family protein [Candidatus Blautia merdigallinarum]
MNFREELERRTERAEQIIRKFLPAEEGFSKNLIKAMNYSMEAGGKRLRPIFLGEMYQVCGGQGELAEPFMAAIEMIHTHSLIHDDLPAIDNDEYRRGKKTTHVVFGESAAILAGDALLNYAYETAFQAFAMAKDDKDLQRTARALEILGRKTGIRGMLGGQGVDVENDGKPLKREMLDYIYINKTSALIEASLMAGAALAGEEDLDSIEAIGRYVGLAFQIQDDILDVTGDQEELGKPVGSDEKNHKTTYVTLEGMEKAGQEVERLTGEALKLLKELPGDKEFLKELFLSLCTRRK